MKKNVNGCIAKQKLYLRKGKLVKKTIICQDHKDWIENILWTDGYKYKIFELKRSSILKWISIQFQLTYKSTVLASNSVVLYNKEKNFKINHSY